MALFIYLQIGFGKGPSRINVFQDQFSDGFSDPFWVWTPNPGALNPWLPPGTGLSPRREKVSKGQNFFVGCSPNLARWETLPKNSGIYPGRIFISG